MNVIEAQRSRKLFEVALFIPQKEAVYRPEAWPVHRQR